MPTTRTDRNRQRRIKREGFESEQILRKNPWQTWYRQDGKAIQGQVDPYHFDLFTGKGWTLRPPVSPVPVEEGQRISDRPVDPATIEAAIGPTEQAAAQPPFQVPAGYKLVADIPKPIPQFIQPAVSPVTEQFVTDYSVAVPTHRHRMSPNDTQCYSRDDAGVRCKYVRQIPYDSRKDEQEDE